MTAARLLERDGILGRDLVATDRAALGFRKYEIESPRRSNGEPVTRANGLRLRVVDDARASEQIVEIAEPVFRHLLSPNSGKVVEENFPQAREKLWLHALCFLHCIS